VTELNKGTVARYCKPSTLNEQCNPNASCFQKREKESYLSVYLFEHFKKSTEQEGIAEVKKEMEKGNFKLKSSGKFAVLDIEQSKNYIFTQISELISYKALNLPHCGIFYEYDDLVIAELLSQCTKKHYPVK
jgi:beta-N-acetylglucosaminidase